MPQNGEFRAFARQKVNQTVGILVSLDDVVLCLWTIAEVLSLLSDSIGPDVIVQNVVILFLPKGVATDIACIYDLAAEQGRNVYFTLQQKAYSP